MNFLCGPGHDAKEKAAVTYIGRTFHANRMFNGQYSPARTGARPGPGRGR